MNVLAKSVLIAAAILQWVAADAMYAYTGVAGGMTLPTGSSEVRRGGTASAIVGWGVAEALAFEVSGGVLEGDGFAAADTLWHWTGFAVYDRYFGFSAWDPFFLGGFSAVFGEDGDCGPEAGFGLFYHFDDRWSLRIAAKAQLGLENDVSVAFALSGGLCFVF